MCIVVDPPTLIPMFKTDDPEHPNFAPVKDWLTTGPGKLVIGGTKFKSELTAVSSMLRLIMEFDKRGKVLRQKDCDVDADEVIVKGIEPASDFDDPHLVALVRLSGAKLICTRDLRSHKYLRATKFYRTTLERPKLYTRAKNSALLCVENIPNRYR